MLSGYQPKCHKSTKPLAYGSARLKRSSHSSDYTLIILNIAAARAVDRKFNYELWLRFGSGEARGLRRPARTTLHPEGLHPPDHPKGAPRPLLQRLASCLWNEPLVQGSCAARGIIFPTTLALGSPFLLSLSAQACNVGITLFRPSLSTSRPDYYY